MCGVSGLFRMGFKGSIHSAIQGMTDLIKHRGPDGEGYVGFTSNTADFYSNLSSIDSSEDWIGALGHRRLSIIDLSNHAAQPMNCSKKRFWISYNGELYNYLEIKKELERKGIVFRTSSDTEVIPGGILYLGGRLSS